MTGVLKTAAAAATLTLGLLAGSGTTASAVTIDFDKGVGGSSYTEDGFTVTGTGMASSGDFGTPAPSTIIDPFTPSLTVTRELGGAFDLISFDAQCLIIDGAGCPATLFISGVKANGSAIAQSALSADSIWGTLSPTGYTGLTSFTLTWAGTRRFLIDTIKVEAAAELTPVPLPASAGLLAVALAGTAALARRKRRAA